MKNRMWSLIRSIIFMYTLDLTSKNCIGQLSEATLYTSPLTWNDAQEHCQSVGQNLIVIDKAYKSTELIPYITESVKEFWMGFNSLDGNMNKWIWPTEDNITDYTNWIDGHPSENNEDLCSYVNVSNSDLKWIAAPCSTTVRPFMCELRIDNCTYEVIPDVKGEATRGLALEPVSRAACVWKCERIAQNSFCWGFLYNALDKRCRPYDVYDDPYYNDLHRTALSLYETHIRRCGFRVKINQTMIGEGVTSEPTTVEIKTTIDTTVELIDCIGHHTDKYTNCYSFPTRSTMVFHISANVSSVVRCVMLCNENDQCKGCNYNEKTGACEFVSTGQNIGTVNATDWALYKKEYVECDICSSCYA